MCSSLRGVGWAGFDDGAALNIEVVGGGMDHSPPPTFWRGGGSLDPPHPLLAGHQCLGLVACQLLEPLGLGHKRWFIFNPKEKAHFCRPSTHGGELPGISKNFRNFRE